MVRGLVAFAITYALVASRRLRLVRLDRPAGALIAAVLAVLVGAVSPEEAAPARVFTARSTMTLGVILGAVVIYTLGGGLSFTALGGFVVLLVIHRDEPARLWERVDEMAKLPDATLAWELLAMASTFARNLTLLGSVANVIVAEKAGPVGGLRFGGHLKVGVPVAVVTTFAGALILVGLRLFT